MGNLLSIYESGFLSTYNFEDKIFKPLTDNRKYSTVKIKNIPFPINIINDSQIKRSCIMFIFDIGYFIESQNDKYDNYIQLLIEIIFETKNEFTDLFDKYNLKYYNKIDIEKTIVYFEFDYNGFENILTMFIKLILNFDNLLAKNDVNKILNCISISKNTDCNYISYKKFLKSYIIKRKESKILDIHEFFQYYFLKNENIRMTLLSPYTIKKCRILLNNIFFNLKNEIKNKIIKRYEKYYNSGNLNSKLYFDEPYSPLLIMSKIDLSNNNIMKIIFYFPSLESEQKKILYYISYMLQGRRPGSLYYDLYKIRYINNLKVYPILNMNIPSQLILKLKLYKDFSMFNLKIIISKLINFLHKLREDRNLIISTYNNFQKILFQNFIFKRHNNDINHFNDLYEVTNNFISLQKKYKNKDNIYLNLLSYKYILPINNIFNANIIENCIDEIIHLNNMIIIMELFPKTFSPLINNLKGLSLNNIILNENIEVNEYNTNILAKIDKYEITKYSSNTLIYDNPMFKPNQDKSMYISNNIFSMPNKENGININDNKIHLALNTISNKLWYKYDEDNNVNFNSKKSSKIYSSFHLIFPNIRNRNSNIYQLNLQYFNHLFKTIELEFEELFTKGNEDSNNGYYIDFVKDDNGFNLEISTYKDVYMLFLEKIFSYIFEFEKNFTQYINVDYNLNTFKDIVSRALWYLKQVIKKEIQEKYFERQNMNFDVKDVKAYVNEISQNIYVDGLLYGVLDVDIIKEVRELLISLNTREYDNYCFYTDIKGFKERVYKYRKIKEGNIHIYKLRQNFLEDNLNYYLSFYQIINFDDNYKEIFVTIIYLLLKKCIPQCNIYKIFTDNIYYFLIIRKSFDCPEYAAKHTTNNIKQFVDLFYSKSNSEIKSLCLDLKDEINNEISDVKNKFKYYWNKIYYDQYNFDKYDSIKEFFEKNLEMNSGDEWVNEFKIFLKDNLFDKQRKIEFLFYQELLKIKNSKDINCYPCNFYNNYCFKVFTYNSVLSFDGEDI